MLGTSRSNGADTWPGRSGFRPRHWAQAQAENPLARFVPFSSLVSPNDVITRGGDYLRVWRLDGVAFECVGGILFARQAILQDEGRGAAFGQPASEVVPFVVDAELAVAAAGGDDDRHSVRVAGRGQIGRQRGLVDLGDIPLAGFGDLDGLGGCFALRARCTVGPEEDRLWLGGEERGGAEKSNRG